MQKSNTHIILANLNLPAHQRAVLALVDAYARDPMGNGRPLTDRVKKSLIPALQKHPTTLIFLAYNEDLPVGIAVCFYGFSTFQARPLINIHDLAVQSAYRGRGISRQLLQAVEQKAGETGCCKITLEVQEKNHRARHVYKAAGFDQAEYEPAAGAALFYSKWIEDDT
ncbi:GNAT family N-acetyltransferase [bacterium]|nr:GNAT family N-acetyltransferase [bacterium]